MATQKSIRDLLRAPTSTVDVGTISTNAHEGFPDNSKAEKDRAAEELAGLSGELSELQEKLFAASYVAEDGASTPRLLLVLQGMDTSGKGGVIDHTVGLFSPSGLRLTSFKKPTEEELAHDFLWRIERQVPDAGSIGIFDRSHYEDVLVARVHELAPADEIERRYAAINEFERRLVDSGTVVVKCMLHISRDTQKERLLARLDDPVKQWKFKPGDIDERGHWDDYQAAYSTAIERCQEAAPWYVVPSDRKWYRNWAIGQLLAEHLRELGLDWPKPDYDVAEQRSRLDSDDA